MDNAVEVWSSLDVNIGKGDTPINKDYMGIDSLLYLLWLRKPIDL